VAAPDVTRSGHDTVNDGGVFGANWLRKSERSRSVSRELIGGTVTAGDVGLVQIGLVVEVFVALTLPASSTDTVSGDDWAT
jgi:hypothetical protein